MAHDDKTNEIDPTASSSTPSSEPQAQKLSSALPAESAAITPVSQIESRAELIERARSFLVSPQIRHEHVLAKRKFLTEKGLSDAEIDGLLQELVSLSCYRSALDCLYD